MRRKEKILGTVALLLVINPLVTRESPPSRQTIKAIFQTFNLFEYDTNNDGRFDNIQVQFTLNFTENQQDNVTIKIQLRNLDTNKITKTETETYYIDSGGPTTIQTMDMGFVSSASYFEVIGEVYYSSQTVADDAVSVFTQNPIVPLRKPWISILGVVGSIAIVGLVVAIVFIYFGRQRSTKP